MLVLNRIQNNKLNPYELTVQSAASFASIHQKIHMSHSKNEKVLKLLNSEI